MACLVTGGRSAIVWDKTETLSSAGKGVFSRVFADGKEIRAGA